MSNSKTNPKVDEFLSKAKTWQEEYKILRNIILDCGLTEEFKWMHPCYTLNDKNVVLIHGFKEYVALLFHKGALIKDPQGILVQQTENVQAARQIRFTNAQQIIDMEAVLKTYIKEAIAIEEAGLEVELKKNEEYSVPEELQAKFAEMPALKSAFEELTPGRQRAYLLHFSQAKQAKTRAARVEKYVQHILDGKGLNDK
jgi:uncharacterized protein YdeI (YjbR/CyaY-like superfamily)